MKVAFVISIDFPEDLAEGVLAGVLIVFVSILKKSRCLAHGP